MSRPANRQRAQCPVFVGLLAEVERERIRYWEVDPKLLQ